MEEFGRVAKAIWLAAEETLGYSARGFLRAIVRFDFAGRSRIWLRPSRWRQATQTSCIAQQSCLRCLATCRLQLRENRRLWRYKELLHKMNLPE